MIASGEPPANLPSLADEINGLRHLPVPKHLDSWIGIPRVSETLCAFSKGIWCGQAWY